MTQSRRLIAGVCVALSLAMAGCGWQGVNSLPLPGTAGRGPGAFTIRAQLPDVDNIQRNSRVRVGDVNVGRVTNIELQGWHALLTMKLDGGVNLPANVTVKIGQTSLLGSKHIELATPNNVPARGRLRDGSVIPLKSGGAYPTTEKTLAALSMILNGGGIGQVQDITAALSEAFAGREQDMRDLVEQLDKFARYNNDQIDDIVRAADGLNNLVAQFADQKPVVDKAIKTIPDALSVLKDRREQLVTAVDQVGKLSALAADSVNQTKKNLISELRAVGPVLESAANAGPALTHSLSIFPTFPWPNETEEKWFRGDYANLTDVIDLTLSRIDQSIFTGTRFEGNLTELEMQWGRTIGQMPSPYTGDNPLIAPYHFDQGP